MRIPSGLYTYIPGPSRRPVRTALPLLSASVSAGLNGAAGSVVLQQSFVNTTAATLDTEYILPMDEGAAVTEFQATFDDHTVTGKVEEKAAARAQYDAAVARGDSAALMDEVSAEHFTMQIGNIPAGSTVTVTITYVVVLRNAVGDGDDGLKFVVPGSLAPKYGAVVTPSDVTATLPEHAPLALRLRWYMPQGVASMASPSHPDIVESAEVDDAGTSVTFSTDLPSLTSDFVVVGCPASTAGPALVVEERAVGTSGALTRAAMLTFTPQIEAESAGPVEIRFVIDRSGSMGGTKIEQARKALNLFLRSLPEDCLFGIVGFGSRFDQTFSATGGVAPYDDDSLAVATRYVNGMASNLGGTNILHPLENMVFNKPLGDAVSRQVFVLTDGQVSNTDAVIRACSNAANNSAVPTRVFTLGLGSGASRELVNGMARAGRGSAFFIDEDDTSILAGTVIRQLKQAMQPGLNDLTLEWTNTDGQTVVTNVGPRGNASAPKPSASTPPRRVLGGVKKVLKIGAAGASKVVSKVKGPAPDGATGVAGTPGEGVIQAPYVAPPVFGGERFTVYALLTHSFGAPARVSLTSEASGVSFDLDLEAQPPIQGSGIHALAARSLIRDLEEGSSYMHARGASNTSIDAEIVRLGKTYGLASTRTSFIAVDTRDGEDRQSVLAARISRPTPARVTGRFSKRKKAKKGGRGGFGGGRGRGAPRARLSRSSASAPSAQPSKAKSRRRAAPAPSAAMRGGGGGGGAPMMQSLSLVSSAPASAYREEEKFDSFALNDELCADLACDDGAFSDEDSSDDDEMALAGSSAAAAPIDYNDVILELAMTQSTKGKFAAAALKRIPSSITTTAPAAVADAAAADPDAWATAVVIAFFESAALAAYRDQWELVAGKAKKWLAKQDAGAELLAAAKALF